MRHRKIARQIERKVRESRMLAQIGRLADDHRAGLDYLQIGIDNARPDEISKKSLQALDCKLAWLAEPESPRCLGGFGAREGARIHQHGGHFARSFRPIEAAGYHKSSLFSFAHFELSAKGRTPTSAPRRALRPPRS
jgi:hypothetical protein